MRRLKTVTKKLKYSTTKIEDTKALKDRELNQARSKPDTVNLPVRTARTFVHHHSGTQYCSTETDLLIFPFLQTNITSQMWPSGGKRWRVSVGTEPTLLRWVHHIYHNCFPHNITQYKTRLCSDSKPPRRLTSTKKWPDFHELIWIVIVWEMLINLLNTSFHNGDGSGKVMRNRYPGSDHHRKLLSSSDC